MAFLLISCVISHASGGKLQLVVMGMQKNDSFDLVLTSFLKTNARSVMDGHTLSHTPFSPHTVQLSVIRTQREFL